MTQLEVTGPVSVCRDNQNLFTGNLPKFGFGVVVMCYYVAILRYPYKGLGVIGGKSHNGIVLLVSNLSCVCFLPRVNQIILRVMCSALFSSRSCLIFSMHTQCGVCEMALSDIWQARCSTVIEVSVSDHSFSPKAFYIQRNGRLLGYANLLVFDYIYF
jgi:hypothetical protein